VRVLARSTRLLERGIVYLLAVLCVVYFVFPVFWIMLTSIKSGLDTFALPPKVFFTPTMDNWDMALRLGAARGLYMSVIVTLGSTVASIVLGSLAAFGMSRYGLGGRGLKISLLTVLMTPPVVGIIPLFVFIRTLNLIDTPWALILIYTAMNSPFAAWILAGFFDKIPRDLDEAADLDGASSFSIYRKIIMPLSLPTLLSVAVLVALLAWNEFMLASVLTTETARTLPVLVAGSAVGQSLTYWGLMAATASLSIIPAAALAFIVQRYAVRGLSLGLIASETA
jgi:multiple sugar transport system permease protein